MKSTKSQYLALQQQQQSEEFWNTSSTRLQLQLMNRPRLFPLRAGGKQVPLSAAEMGQIKVRLRATHPCKPSRIDKGIEKAAECSLLERRDSQLITLQQS